MGAHFFFWAKKKILIEKKKTSTKHITHQPWHLLKEKDSASHHLSHMLL